MKHISELFPRAQANLIAANARIADLERQNERLSNLLFQAKELAFVLGEENEALNRQILSLSRSLKAYTDWSEQTLTKISKKVEIV